MDSIKRILSDPRISEGISELHRKQPLWNLKLIAFFAAWGVIGYLIMQLDSWYLRFPGYVILGFMMHGIGVNIHESIHGLLTKKNKLLNYLLGFFSGLPMLLSRGAYKVVHTEHHRFNRLDGDPDELTNITSNKRLQSVLFYVAFLIVGYVYIFLAPFMAIKLARNLRSRLIIIAEYFVIISIFSYIVLYLDGIGRMDIFVNCWLAPFLVLGLTVNIRAMAEHQMTNKGDKSIRRSRTVVTNRVTSFLLFNINYHIEHHLFPSIPWYNLPKAHKLLLAHYKVENAHIVPSYTKVVLDALRYGIHYVEPSKAA
jgi:fatty acid desaturase